MFYVIRAFYKSALPFFVYPSFRVIRSARQLVNRLPNQSSFKSVPNNVSTLSQTAPNKSKTSSGQVPKPTRKRV